VTSEADWSRTSQEQKIDPTSPPYFATRMDAFSRDRGVPRRASIAPPTNVRSSVSIRWPRQARRGSTTWYALTFEERKKLMQGHGDRPSLRVANHASHHARGPASTMGVGVTLFAAD